MRTAGGCCRRHHHASRLHYQDELGLTIHLAGSYSLPLSPLSLHLFVSNYTPLPLSPLFVLSPQAFSLSRFAGCLIQPLTYILPSWLKEFSHIRLTSSSASSHPLATLSSFLKSFLNPSAQTSLAAGSGGEVQSLQRDQ